MTSAGPVPAIVSPTGWSPVGDVLRVGVSAVDVRGPDRVGEFVGPEDVVRCHYEVFGVVDLRDEVLVGRGPVEVGAADAAAIEIVAPVQVARAERERFGEVRSGDDVALDALADQGSAADRA